MKASLMTTAAMLLTFAFPALAGPTENITGCATVAVEGSNYTVRSDVTCALPETMGGDPLLMQVATAAFIDALTPDEDEDEAAK